MSAVSKTSSIKRWLLWLLKGITMTKVVTSLN